jgi:hypothetical protein
MTLTNTAGSGHPDRRLTRAVAAHDWELAGRLAAIDQVVALLDSAADLGARRIAS